MPFGGLVVNRVHAASATEAAAPPRLARELATPAGRRVVETWRTSPRRWPRRDQRDRSSAAARARRPADDRSSRARRRRPRRRRARAVRAHLFGLTRHAGWSATLVCRSRGRGGRRGRRAASRAGCRRARRRGPRRRGPPARGPAIAARSSATAGAMPARQRVALLRARADRGQPPGRRPLVGALGLRAARAREQPVGQRLERRRARSQPSSKRRSAHASSPDARGAAGDEAQNARSASSCAAGDREQSPWAARRSRAGRPSATGRRRSAPRRRAERRLGVVPQPQRGLQPAQPHAGVLDRRRVAGRCLPGQHREDVGVDRRVRQGLAPHEHESLAQVELVGAQVDPEQRRDHDRLGAAVAHDGLELGVGGLETWVAEDEVGGVLERAGEEHAQRVLGALAGVARDRLAARLQVLAQAGRRRESVDGRQVGLQPAQQRQPLVDERARQRAIAVEARAPGVALLDDFEGHLGALGSVVGEQGCGLVCEGLQSVVESRVAHECCGSPRPRTTPARCKNLPKPSEPAVLRCEAAVSGAASCASGGGFVVSAAGSPNRGLCAGPSSCVPSPCSAFPAPHTPPLPPQAAWSTGRARHNTWVTASRCSAG